MYKTVTAFCKIIIGFLFFISIKVEAQPTITSFSPSSGIAGTAVTITGTNFNVVPANNIVRFGAANATVVSGTSTSLTVSAPANATYWPVSVFNNATGLTGYSLGSFIITFTNPFGTGIPVNFFKPKIDFVTGTNPRSVAMGDINGDGKLDMLVANSGSASVSVYLNTSASSGSIPSFTAKVDFATGSNPVSVATGDVNGDGKPDLVIANSGAATLSVLLNTTATGAGTPSFAAKVDFTTGSTPFSVAIGDINGDGKPDIVVANSGAASLSILRNATAIGAGTPSFAARVDFTTGTSPVSVITGDANGDSQPDIMVANSGSATVSVFRNTTPAGGSIMTFAARVDFSTGTTPVAVALGDINADGRPDLLIANSGAASVSVLLNTSSSGGSPTYAARTDFTTGTTPMSVAIADEDGDGMPDLAVANSGASSVSAFRNTTAVGAGTPAFSTKVDFTAGSNPISVLMGDMDGDGIPEIAVANFNANTFSVFQTDLSVLPLTLTNIQVYQKNAGVQLEWTVQQEINIDRYEVERSQNGQPFEKLAIVQARGNGSTVMNYSLFDPHPFSGPNFYRIKIIEAGRETFSKTVRINLSNNSANSISVYPNPVSSNSIALQLQLQKGIYIISLTNKLGQLLVTKRIDYRGGLGTEILEPQTALAAGVYQLRLTGGAIDITCQVLKN